MAESTVWGLTNKKLRKLPDYPDEQDVSANGITYFREDSYKDSSDYSWLSEIFAKASKEQTFREEGRPDFTIVKSNSNIIVVIECKGDVKKHSAKKNIEDYILDGYGDSTATQKYAIDGVLWYGSFLQDRYDVIAIAVSGTSEVESRVTSFVMPKGKTIKDIKIIEKDKDIISGLLSIGQYENDIEIILGRYVETEEAIKKELRRYTLQCANFLRANDIEDDSKAGFISAIILGLTNKESKLYIDTKTAIEEKERTKSKVLANDLLSKRAVPLLRDSLYGKGDKDDGDYENGIWDIDKIPQGKRKSLKIFYDGLLAKKELKQAPRGMNKDFKYGSTMLSCCIYSLYEHVISVVENYKGIDVMGEFYTTFLRFTKGNAKEKGIVLTPKHITDLFCDIAENYCEEKLTENMKILDICCGTGAFLISALNRIEQNIKSEHIGEDEKKRRIEQATINSLIGVEKNESMYALAYANMRFHGDGKSNLFSCSSLMSDSYNPIDERGKTYGKNGERMTLAEALKEFGEIDIGMINPPYALGKNDDSKPAKYPIEKELDELHSKKKELNKKIKEQKKNSECIKFLKTELDKVEAEITARNEEFEKSNLKEIVIQKKQDELDFVASMLHYLKKGGVGIAIVPMSCAGNSGQKMREEILKYHTLLACMTMPPQLFFDSHVGTATCIMVFRAHYKHNEDKSVFFGRWIDDGFKVIPHNGRQNSGKWSAIRREWLQQIDGAAAPNKFVWMKKTIKITDEALSEAYVDTDYSQLSDSDFISNLKKYVLFKYMDENGLLEMSDEDKLNWLLDNYHDFEDKYLAEKQKAVVKLHDREWGEFRLGDKDYFKIERGASEYLKNMVSGDTPYISTTSENNGITAYVVDENRPGNLITLAYDGSIGACFYQELPFFASEKVVTIDIVPYTLNKYIAFFIIQILKLEAEMYSYGGRKWTVEQQLKNTMIKLPINKDREPDWDFMESYIKSLPFSCNI